MTIRLDRLLKHMAWANQETIKHLKTLPEAALSAYATNPEWKVSEIIRHIVESGNFYVFRIAGSFPGEVDEQETQPRNSNDLKVLAEKAEVVDKALLECEKLDDIEIEFVRKDGTKVKRWRSTILSQAVHHATEHRAQIASALEAKGFTPVDLDDLDLWSYESTHG
jgi:uncharacterized damage-inducible protein DinB